MKKSLLLLLLTFFILHASAQQELRYAEDSNSLLWEISGNNLKEPSYIFGTYHFAGRSYLDTLPVINKVFQQAKIVVGEISMGNEILLNAQLEPHMKMSDIKLDKLLSASEYEMVNKYLIKISNGLHLNMFNSKKPAAIQLLLMRYTAPVKLAEKEQLMDLYFQDQGEKLKKEIIGLESIADQGRLLFGRPVKRQKRLLLKFVEQADKKEEQAVEMFEYYKSQDIENLEKTFSKYKDYTNKELNSLLKNRNIQWMKKLPAIMSKGSAFIAVGGGHLLGKYGMLNLLRQAGYVVRPIETKKAIISYMP